MHFILGACTECTQQVQFAPIKVLLVSTLSRESCTYLGNKPTQFMPMSRIMIVWRQKAKNTPEVEVEYVRTFLVNY